MTTALTITALNNAATDLQRISEFMESSSPTMTTRLGASVATRAGLVADLNAAAAITETGTNRAAAEAAQVGAEAAEAQAANYAAAAATGAKFFDTIALGRAGVADGATFGVKAGGSDALTRPTVYRREAAGGQTALYAVLPASEFDSRISVFDFTNSNGFDHAWTDPVGNVGVGYRAAEGALYVFAVKATNAVADKYGFNATDANAVAVSDVARKIAQAVADGNGNTALEVLQSGETLAYKISAKSVAADFVNARGVLNAGDFGLYEVNHVILYGQSLSIGFNAVPVLTASQPYNSLMFNGGVQTSVAMPANTDLSAGQIVANHASLVPLVEAAVESPVSGIAESVVGLIAQESGIDYTQHSYQLLMSAPGKGAQAIASLAKGTAYYTNLIGDVTYGKALAQAANKPYICRAVCWMQGEANQGAASPTYLTPFKQLYTDLNTDIKAASGQTEDVHLISYQLSTENSAKPTVAFQQYQASLDVANIHIACPMYFFDYVDGQHLDGNSSKWAGAYFGLVYKRVVIDKQTWTPLSPKATLIQGNALVLQMNVPVRPLVLDTTRVTQQTNYGFELFQADGTTAVTISSVSVIGPDKIKIVAASALSAGMVLRYASAGYTAGAGIQRFQSRRGNLRDSQGDRLVFNNGGSVFPLHNWCIHFERTL